MTRSLLTIPLACLALFAAGCGGDDDEDTGTTGAESSAPAETTDDAPASGDVVTIDMKNIQFDPKEATVKVGQTVRWVNQDSVDHDAKAEEGDLVIEVNGKQWWWEVIYGENADGENLGVVTANEIRVPAGKEVIFKLKSNNVIHSFWVPRLSGKLDVIPGHENKLSITAEEPGVYLGECAEFCGTQHAWMRFRVVAMPEDEFYGWINAMRTGNPGTTNQEAELPEGVTRAPEEFNVCLACHAVNGFEGGATLHGMEAPRTFGPSLTNLACRETIAAGLLMNTPENLRQWIHDPDSVKEGNYMSTQIKPGMFSDEQLAALLDYLLTLKPAGG